MRMCEECKYYKPYRSCFSIGKCLKTDDVVRFITDACEKFEEKKKSENE